MAETVLVLTVLVAMCWASLHWTWATAVWLLWSTANLAYNLYTTDWWDVGWMSVAVILWSLNLKSDLDRDRKRQAVH